MTIFHSINIGTWADTVYSRLLRIALGSLIVLMSMNSHSAEPSAKLREVKIKLFGSVKEIEGVELPAGFDVRNSDFDFQIEPAKVTVVLPDGEAKTIVVKAYYYTAHQGVVLTVGLMPMMNVGTDEETRTEIFKALQILNIKIDDKIREAAKHWTFPRMYLSENTAVRAMIKSDFNNRTFADIAFDVVGDMYNGFTFHGWKEFSECMKKELADSVVQEKLAPVSIRLEGLASEAVGLDKSDGDRFYPYHRFEPGMLTIHSPDGTTNQLPVRAILLDVYREKVTGIELIPFMKRVSYKEAIQELYRTLKVLNIEPDEKMKASIALWPEDQPNSGYGLDYETLVVSGKTFSCAVEVRPHIDGGWFVHIILGTPDEVKSPKPADKLKTSPDSKNK